MYLERAVVKLALEDYAENQAPAIFLKLCAWLGRSVRMNNKRSFRNLLIPATVENAVKIPFYRTLWPEGVAERVRTVDDLISVPVIDKPLYSRHYQDALPADQIPAIVSHSTGTTTGMTFRYRSNAEVGFIRAFFERVQAKIGSTDQEMPLVISIPGYYHGGRIPIPGRVYTLLTGVSEKVELEQTIHLLLKEFQIPRVGKRVSQIHATLVDLKLITFALLEKNISPDSLFVRTLITTGEYVSPVWKSYLEDVWRAQLMERYSLSEIFGGAILCSRCGLYHVDALVVPEVVDPFTRTPIKSGVGVLVLTELYPFVQYQPLIRYWTGDLVEAVESECDPGAISFRFLGRAEFSIMSPEGHTPEVLITPVSLQDVLEDIPEVAKQPLFSHIPALSDYELGEPLSDAKLESGEDGRAEVRLRVGCQFNPLFYRERARYVENTVAERLLSENPNLKRAAENGTCKLVVEAVSKEAFSSARKE